MVKIYVEGGGDSSDLKTRCRKAFRIFLENYGFKGKMPRIVACGGRSKTFGDFCTSVENEERAVLLVDSEDLVQESSPWQHLARRKGDEWKKPLSVGDDSCHLMVVCMESWLLCDREALKKFFGQGFNENILPSEGRDVESIEKKEIYDVLDNATRNTMKGSYRKGSHSFEILERVSPHKVESGSEWARRFFASLKKEMSRL